MIKQLFLSSALAVNDHSRHSMDAALLDTIDDLKNTVAEMQDSNAVLRDQLKSNDNTYCIIPIMVYNYFI